MELMSNVYLFPYKYTIDIQFLTCQGQFPWRHSNVDLLEVLGSCPQGNSTEGTVVVFLASLNRRDQSVNIGESDLRGGSSVCRSAV